MTRERIEVLQSKGFRRWTKGAKDRLYINASDLGLVCTYYNTGNIRSAHLNGDSISNSRARKMKAAKTFIDLHTDILYSDDSALAHLAADLTGLDYDAKSWDTMIHLK